MRQWIVPVKVTLRGYAVVEAQDSEAAERLIAAGAFEVEPGAEMTDWETAGMPKEDK